MKIHRRPYDPAAQPVLALGRIDHLQVALNGDAQKINHGAVDRTPEQIFIQEQHTEPVAERSGKMDAAKLHGVRCNQEQRFLSTSQEIG